MCFSLQDDVLLEAEDLYYLLLKLPETVDEDTASAVFNKKKQRLTLTVDVLWLLWLHRGRNVNDRNDWFSWERAQTSYKGYFEVNKKNEHAVPMRKDTPINTSYYAAGLKASFTKPQFPWKLMADCFYWIKYVAAVVHPHQQMVIP